MIAVAAVLGGFGLAALVVGSSVLARARRLLDECGFGDYIKFDRACRLETAGKAQILLGLATSVVAIWMVVAS